MPEQTVSVIITSYNQEAFLREAVESAINQTVRAHEIIIADDHSTKDNSVSLIRDYESRYPGWIRGVLQSQNVFIPLNRNAALATATGRYVAIVDGDDRLLPPFIERHLAALRANPNAGCSYSNRFVMTATGERRGPRFSEPKPSGDIFAHVAAGEVGILRTMVARHDLVKNAGFLEPDCRHHDGYLLTLRLAKMTEFIYVPEPLMEKREHASGTSRGTSATKRFRSQERVYQELVQLTADLPASARRRIEWQWYWKMLIPRVLSLAEAGQKMRAYIELAKAALRSPTRRRMKMVLGLARKVAKGDTTMERN